MLDFRELPNFCSYFGAINALKGSGEYLCRHGKKKGGLFLVLTEPGGEELNGVECCSVSGERGCVLLCDRALQHSFLSFFFFLLCTHPLRAHRLSSPGATKCRLHEGSGDTKRGREGRQQRLGLRVVIQ